ncbi:MAG: class I SAM-dependent methyltransferase [Opitutaceae bacterium]
MNKLSTEDAVRLLRSDPDRAALVHDTYLDTDLGQAAERFAGSGEFAAVLKVLGPAVEGAVVMDLGAGNGMASRAFALQGARCVHAVEPDPSKEIGRGAIEITCAGLPVEIHQGFGEAIPLPNASVDLIYTRQVLHHTTNLGQTLRECARVLRSGGRFLACREHVVDDAQQMAEFLAHHPVHQLTGGEGAYTLDAYEQAIVSAGLTLEKSIDPWASPINTAPAANTVEEIADFPRKILRSRFGEMGARLAAIPWIRALVWRRLRRPRPGRLYSFFASKP